MAAKITIIKFLINTRVENCCSEETHFNSSDPAFFPFFFFFNLTKSFLEDKIQPDGKNWFISIFRIFSKYVCVSN